MNLEQKYLTSLEVAEMVGTPHNDLMKSIRKHIEYLGEGNFSQSDFFVESTYTNNQNKVQPCFNITKKGCELIANKMTGAKGTQFTATYINKFHDMEETIANNAIDRTQLSPQMQMLFAMVETQANLELEQKRQSERLDAAETRVDKMVEVFTAEIANWSDEINSMVRKIADKRKIDYQMAWHDMYYRLESKARCSLKTRQANTVKRLTEKGYTKTSIKKMSTFLACIEADKQLKAIFEQIVKEQYMAYCV